MVDLRLVDGAELTPADLETLDLVVELVSSGNLGPPVEVDAQRRPGPGDHARRPPAAR